MFHVSVFGGFCGALTSYADTRGFVPEIGDCEAWFRYDGDFDEETWQEWVEAAAAETKRAERAVAEWRRHH